VLAEKTFRQAQDQLHLAHVIHNIGMVYRRLKRWSEAIEAYQTSIKLWEQLGNVERMVNTMDGLGLVHFERGDFLTAKAIFEEALARLKKIEGEPGYEHKFKMVTADLQQTLEAIASIQA
jgi:tetratricopeptide (TPR) repeat protein